MDLLPTLYAMRADLRRGYIMHRKCICAELIARMSQDFPWRLVLPALYAAFRAWPKYSGDDQYPIQFNLARTHCVAMWAGYDYEWGWGALRIELLDHCIAYFEENGS